MKPVIIASAILILVIGLTTVNTVYLHRATGTLLDTLNTLPEQMDEAQHDLLQPEIEKLFKTWDENIRIMSYTVGYAQINRADTAINTLYIAFYSDNSDDYAIARREAIDAITRLKTLQGVHFETIL